jgi:hypothetical protein
MRQLILYKLIVVCLIFVSGSCKNAENNLLQALKLELCIHNLELNHERQVQDIALISNASWVASSDQGWCVPTPSVGENNTEIKIDIEENTETTDRNAKIIFKCLEISDTLYIIQKGIPVYDLKIKNDICVWENGKHAAFTNLVKWNDDIFLSFREGENHAPQNESEYGNIRILKFNNGSWEQFTLISKENCDLRDPFLSVTPDNELILHCGYNRIIGGKLQHCGTFYSKFSNNTFGSLESIVHDIPHIIWIWKIRWHKNKAYGIGYLEGEKPVLFSSPDGIVWAKITTLDIPGIPTEADIHFASNEMAVFIRRDGSTAYIGTSQFPFESFSWIDTKQRIESPDLFYHSDTKKLLLVGRHRTDTSINVELFEIKRDLSIESLAVLETNKDGDKAYPSIIEHEKEKLYISFYTGSTNSAVIKISEVSFVKVN